MGKEPYRTIVLWNVKDAGEVGQWPTPPVLYLPVTWGTLSFLLGIASLAVNERYFFETLPGQIEQALNTLMEQVTERPRDIPELLVELGAILDITLEVDSVNERLMYRVMYGEEWGPWLDAGPLLPGPQGIEGVKGDRSIIYGERTAPNSYMTLYRQDQEIDPETGDYIDVGQPVDVGILYDGWVNVGFWYPYMVDNEDGTITFWRQWYCRHSAESNVFDPTELIEQGGTATLPPGPPGGHYLITSENPQPHVANLFREFQTWDPVNLEWVPSGIVEQFGGLIAPQGPIGEDGRVGDYFELLADTPEEQPNTIVLYKQRHHGVTDDPIGTIIPIGSAVALQGEQGIPGEVGPPGTQATWDPREDFLNSTEWQRVSWVALSLTRFVAASIERTVRYTSAALGVEAGVLAGAGAVAGLAVGGPFGAAVGAIAGISIGILAPVADGALMVATEPLRTEADIIDISKEFYCRLLDYRYFDTASLESFTAQYEGNSLINAIIVQDFLSVVSFTLADHWREIGMVEAQKEIALMLLNYEYNPNYDYTSLPCTPVIGTDQRVYDFTIDGQGWYVTPNGQGEYMSGQGWGDTVYDGSYHYITVGVDWGGPFVVTYFEVLYDMPDSGSGQYVPFWQYVGGPSQQNNNNPEGTNIVWSENAPNNAQECTGIRLYIPSATPGGAILRRVSMTFDGDVPA